MKKQVLLLTTALLLLPITTATTIDFTCPDDIISNEPFICELEILEGNGVYDVKIELKQGSETIIKVYNDETWKSGYYYLQEFITNGQTKEVQLQIEREGTWEGLIKLRQASTIETFPITLTTNNNQEESSSKKVSESKLPPKEPTQQIITNKQKPTTTLTLNQAPTTQEEPLPTPSFFSQGYLWRIIVLLIIVITIRVLWEKL